MLVCRERGYDDGSTCSVWQHYCLAPMAVQLSSTGISHHNLLLHIPLIHLSAVNSSPAPQSLNSSSQPLCFLGTCIPVPVQGTMYGCSKDCLILIAFKLPHVSCFCLKCFSSNSDNCPDVRIRPLLQRVFPSAEGRSNPTNTPVSPPSSFVLPSFVWFYILFSTGQLLLSTVSWCSVCTSVSEGVFLMYPWTDRYFTSTYSAILFL